MKEMAEHKRKNSKMKIYFPYSPWQRVKNNKYKCFDSVIFG